MEVFVWIQLAFKDFASGKVTITDDDLKFFHFCKYNRKWKTRFPLFRERL
jgi:hypothetical protein